MMMHLRNHLPYIFGVTGSLLCTDISNSSCESQVSQDSAVFFFRLRFFPIGNTDWVGRDLEIKQRK